QAQRSWLRQGRDGLRRSPRGRAGSGRAALSRRACRGWWDLRHEKKGEDGGGCEPREEAGGGRGWGGGPGSREEPAPGRPRADETVRGGTGQSAAVRDG